MIKTKLQLKKFSPEGMLLETRSQEARSWLKHIFDIFYVQMNNGASLAGINDIDGVARTLEAVTSGAAGNLLVGSSPGGTQAGYTRYSSWPYLSQIDGQNIGIVVGTGNVPVTPAQNALQTKIAHGEGAGELLYGGTELYGLAFADPNGQFTIRRYFNNILGGAVTVQEIGIYAVGVVTLSTSYSFCIARDVVAPGITVNNGEILEVTYTPQITV